MPDWHPADQRRLRDHQWGQWQLRRADPQLGDQHKPAVARPGGQQHHGALIPSPSTPTAWPGSPPRSSSTRTARRPWRWMQQARFLPRRVRLRRSRRKARSGRRSPRSFSQPEASRGSPRSQSRSSPTPGSTGRPGSPRVPTSRARRGRFTSQARESASDARYFAPSFAAASRMFLTVASGALRPSSFSPWRLTQMVGTFSFSAGPTSVS